MVDDLTVDEKAVRDALKRVLASKSFASSPRLMDFLTYIVGQKLLGKEAELKAYTIAVDALGKPSDFDPQMDPIVRIVAGRLRSALQEYYYSEGADDPLVISVPLGGYRPVFEANDDPMVETNLEEKIVAEKQAVLASSRSKVWLIVLVVLLLSFVGYLLVADRTPTVGSNSISVKVTSISTRAKESREARNSRGFVQQLLTTLSRNDGLTVATPQVDNKSEQQFNFVVGAKTEFVADKTKLSVELTNGQSGAVVWARNFEVEQPEGEPVPGNIVNEITRELQTQILADSVKALEGRAPETLSARQLFILATWIPGPAQNSLNWETQRIELARRAIQKDPEFGPAYSVLADKLAYLANMDAPSNTPSVLKEAKENRDQALHFAARDSNTMFNIAQSYWHSGKVNDAIRTMKRTLELDPNHALADFFQGVLPYTCTPATDEVLQTATEFDASLGADNPVRWVTLTWLGWLHLNRNEFELALEAERRAAQIFQIPYTIMRHATILNLLGKKEDARNLIMSQRRNWPNLNPVHFAEVTMPRLCSEFPDEKLMLGFYRKLATDIGPLLSK